MIKMLDNILIVFCPWYMVSGGNVLAAQAVVV